MSTSLLEARGRLTVCGLGTVVSALAFFALAYSQEQKKSRKNATGSTEAPVEQQEKSPLPPTEKNLDEKDDGSLDYQLRAMQKGANQLLRAGRILETPSARAPTVKTSGTGKPATGRPPTGFGDFALGMDGHAVAALVQRWERNAQDVSLQDDRYAGTSAVHLTFADRRSVSFHKGNWKDAAAPMTSLPLRHLAVVYERMPVPEKAFVNELVRQYGNPTQRQVFEAGLLGKPPIAAGARRALFGDWTDGDILVFKDRVYTANTKLVWSWPTVDVDLTCSIEVYPILNKFGVWLEMDQGLRKRAAAKRAADAQEAERQAAERDRTVNALRQAVRPQPPAAPVPQDPAPAPHSTEARNARWTLAFPPISQEVYPHMLDAIGLEVCCIDTDGKTIHCAADVSRGGRTYTLDPSQGVRIGWLWSGENPLQKYGEGILKQCGLQPVGKSGVVYSPKLEQQLAEIEQAHLQRTQPGVKLVQVKHTQFMVRPQGRDGWKIVVDEMTFR